MIINPTSTYSGLTVVAERSLRFPGIASSWAEAWFDNCLLADAKYGVHRGTIQIRTPEEAAPFLPNTKVLLLLGESAHKRFQLKTNLMEQRGSPFTYEDKTCISSFGLQDSFDRKQFFAAEDAESDGEGSEDDSEGKSTHGRTRRKNFKFWLRQDIRKAVRLTRSSMQNGEPRYELYPDAGRVIELLSTTRDSTIYFDIETDSCLQLTCFGFSFLGSELVYVVPGVQTHFTPRKYYYDELTWAKILRALSIALCRNTVVIHNSMFDLFVLVWRYGLPIGNRVFDTMLAHSRCYIEVEKSLGHCISLYTNLPYHKNEGVFEPRNQAETEDLYRYNGKDVYAMKLLKPAIEERAKLLGASESVEQVNRMVVPYLTSTLQGTPVDYEKINTIIAKNDRMKLQISRILRVLLSKEEFNPNSPKQVATYIYDELGIERPKKDLTNEKTLLQLFLKVEIPAIHAILEYRKVGKQTSKLQFTPYLGLWRADRYNSDMSPREDYTGQRYFTTSWVLAGTTSYRLSSRELLRYWGGNFQNWEKYLRKVIVPA